ncbi:MAG TPA: hypothetical protein VF221_00395 [Chloroflexota bacterium]
MPNASDRSIGGAPRTSQIAMFTILNVFMRLLLRSPLHGVLSGNTLLISFTGKSSGKRYVVPVSYMQDGSTVTCFTAARWWKNLRGDAPVTLRLRGKDVAGTAQVEAQDKDAVAQGLSTFLQRVRRDAGFYRVTMDPSGVPEWEDVVRAAQRNVMIRIDLSAAP